MAQVATPSLPSAARPIQALVLDAAPFLSHSTPPTSLLCRAERVYTTPAVLSEIRDPEARARLEIQWLPFITARSPRAESVRRVSDLAKKTGDQEVLSGTDLGILGLAFELECELRGGDEWVRKDEDVGKKEVITGGVLPKGDVSAGNTRVGPTNAEGKQGEEITHVKPVGDGIKRVDLPRGAGVEEDVEEGEEQTDALNSEDSDGGEWITPSNIHKFRREEEGSTALASDGQDTPIFAACATSDFAMQNILLLLPIPLVSPTSPYMRIRTIKQWLLRCHACFYITRVMKHQFCPRCGGPTLLRTSCSTDSETGKTTIFLKKNFQWNNRGNVFAVPKPTGGRASGREGAGIRHELILRADQKEYVRQREEIDRRSRKGERDLMDGDYLPGILTGERNWHGDRVKIGHGRQNPNAQRRGGKRKK